MVRKVSKNNFSEIKISRQRHDWEIPRRQRGRAVRALDLQLRDSEFKFILACIIGALGHAHSINAEGRAYS